MDLIDESMTHYESVIGMSVLSDDGLLPVTVLCEVIEEELEMQMGYRGFSSMAVGIRAVGRMRRCDVNSNNSDTSSRSTIDKNARTTALDDIHRGKVVDLSDDPLDEEQDVMANEYKENILSILRLTQNEEEQRLSEKLRIQQRHYNSVYDAITNSSDKVDNNLTATSWGAFAAATAIDRPISDDSVNIEALSTTNTVERLRLGLAMLLENQMPLQSIELKSIRGNGGKSTSLQDDIDTFQ